MSLPWFKFSPAAWRGDQALRAVSLAARGLWIECLCIMHEAKPYGHLTLNGAAIDDDTLARMTGVSVDVVRALMAELRKAGVLSVTGKGVVFSRRMTKDFAKAQKGRKAANQRWAQVPEMEQDFGGPNGLPNGDPNTHKRLDTGEGRIDKPPAPTSEPQEARAIFNQIWEAFPQNPLSNDAKAEAIFNATKATDHSLILAAALRFRQWFAEDNEERKRSEAEGLRFAPHLSTWLAGDWRKSATLPLKADRNKPDPDLAVIEPNSDDFKAIERLRGKKLMVGQSGRVTVRRSELEQARAVA